MKSFDIGSNTLAISDVLNICEQNYRVNLSRETLQKVRQSAENVASMIEKGDVVYGINTGFGPLCSTVISKADTNQLQDNILRSHSVGVGKPISPLLSKMMMVLKLQSLSLGYSGIQTDTLERIQFFINQNIIPVVPEQGSVGASGDLAPLAHLFLPLIGLGEVYLDGEKMPSALMHQVSGIEPLNLKAKEGLALINGTQFIAAHTALGVARMHKLLNVADIIGAMSLEGVLGSASPFVDTLHEIRPFKGSILVAHRMRNLLQNSEMIQSHADCGRVQDPYSIRCIPQVHGSSRNAWLHVKELTDIEINSVTDNPIILSENIAISGGNFHGQPLAMAADYLTLAAHEIGNISDRRIYLLLEGGHEGLPKLLMNDIGLNSGFMIPQYTSAALVSENKALCFPASADSIPTSLGQEDHVSMGSISSRKLNQVLDNLEQILAIELVTATQAFDFRRPLKSSPILEACHQYVRTKIDHADKDRIFAKDIAKAHLIIKENKLNEIAREIANKENIDLNGSYHGLFNIS